MYDGLESQARSPANVEIEQAVLSSLLIRNSLYDEISNTLAAAHFSVPLHARIFEAIGKLLDRGEKATPPALATYLRDDEGLMAAGGSGYLARIAAAGGSLDILGNVRTLVELWKRRALIAQCQQTINRAAAFSFDEVADGMARDHGDALYEIVDGSVRGGGPIDAGSAGARAIASAQHAYRNAGRLLGVPSGLADLDRLLGGFRDGHLVILAGRPSMGKTLAAGVFAVMAARSFADAAAASGAPAKAVLFCSLEMTAEELAGRWLASKTDLDASSISRGRLGIDDWTRLDDARQDLGQLPLLVDDTPGVSLSDIRSRARRVARCRGLGLVVVDHMALVRVSKDVRRNGETAVLTEVSGSLKALAKELSVPVLALSQLNRELERRDDKRPMLADLRQSGSIEQDADVVMFVYRDEYYLSRAEPARKSGERLEAYQSRLNDWNEALDASRNKASIIVAKHRNGPTGTVQAYFDGARGVLANLVQADLPL